MQKLIIVNNKRKIVTVPEAFKNIVFGYDTDYTDRHIADGFYNVVIPTLAEHQKIDYNLENGTIENDVFTYAIITLTQAEIDAQLLEEENRPILDLLEKFESDGNTFYNDVKLLVKKHHTKGTITDAQFKSIRVVLEPAMRPLKLGDFDIAQDNINAITRPSGTLAPLYDFVKDKIDNYLS